MSVKTKDQSITLTFDEKMQHINVKINDGHSNASDILGLLLQTLQVAVRDIKEEESEEAYAEFEKDVKRYLFDATDKAKGFVQTK